MTKRERGLTEERSPIPFTRPLPLALLISTWTLPALATTIMMSIRDQPNPAFTFWPGFLTQCAVWLPWAPVTPIAFSFGARFTLTRGKWFRSAAVHLGAALLFAVLFNLYLIISELALFGQRPFAITEIWIIFTDRPRAVLSTMPIYLLIWATGRGIAFYQRGRAREALLAQARLRLLESRLQPHFLFNTLHAIATLMEENVDGARRMIVQLSELLRASLNAQTHSEVTLAEELTLLKNYLAIEQIRFADRLTIDFHIDPETLTAQVPQFLLQPLVENAVRHGISRISDAGALTITTEHDGGRIIITIEDDGPGLSNTTKEGLGLSITRERLAVRHGGAADLIVVNRDPRGCQARISLPFLTEEST